MKRSELLAAVPVHELHGRPYFVDLGEIPEPGRFSSWVRSTVLGVPSSTIMMPAPTLGVSADFGLTTWANFALTVAFPRRVSHGAGSNIAGDGQLVIGTSGLNWSTRFRRQQVRQTVVEIVIEGVISAASIVEKSFTRPGNLTSRCHE